MVHQNFFTGSSGIQKRKNVPFKTHKMTPKFSLLLFEFCYQTTDMNEATAKRSNKDAAMLPARRAKVLLSCKCNKEGTGIRKEFSGFKSHFPGGRKKSLQL